MNWQLSRLEEMNNSGVTGYNNPTLADQPYAK